LSKKSIQVYQESWAKLQSLRVRLGCQEHSSPSMADVVKRVVDKYLERSK
jgi:hypothetical protein